MALSSLFSFSTSIPSTFGGHSIFCLLFENFLGIFSEYFLFPVCHCFSWLDIFENLSLNKFWSISLKIQRNYNSCFTWTLRSLSWQKTMTSILCLCLCLSHYSHLYFLYFKSEDFNSSIKEVPGTTECGFSSVCSGLSGLITFV